MEHAWYNIYLLAFLLGQGAYILFGLWQRTLFKLGLIFQPFLILLGGLAFAPEQTPFVWPDDSALKWHILLALCAHTLFSYAAVCGVALFIRERQLKHHSMTKFSVYLPPVERAERALFVSLGGGCCVLAFALFLGGISQVHTYGHLGLVDGKVVGTLLTLVISVCVLATHYIWGTRGRKAAQMACFIYLILVLGYFMKSHLTLWW